MCDTMYSSVDLATSCASASPSNPTRSVAFFALSGEKISCSRCGTTSQHPLKARLVSTRTTARQMPVLISPTYLQMSLLPRFPGSFYLEDGRRPYGDVLVHDVAQRVKLRSEKRQEHSYQRRVAAAVARERRHHKTRGDDEDAQPLQPRYVGSQETAGVDGAENGDRAKSHLEKPTPTIHHARSQEGDSCTRSSESHILTDPEGRKRDTASSASEYSLHMSQHPLQYESLPHTTIRPHHLFHLSLDRRRSCSRYSREATNKPHCSSLKRIGETPIRTWAK